MNPGVLKPTLDIPFFNFAAVSLIKRDFDLSPTEIRPMLPSEQSVWEIQDAIPPTGIESLSTFLNETQNVTTIVDTGFSQGLNLISTIVNQPDYMNPLNQIDCGTVLNRTDYLSSSLNQAYVMDGRSEVEAFVLRYHLRQILEEADAPLKAAFGQTATKVLKLIADDEGSQTLFCLVMVPGSMESARRSLKSFDQDWWIERCGLVAGKLSFDYELV